MVVCRVSGGPRDSKIPTQTEGSAVHHVPSHRCCQNVLTTTSLSCCNMPVLMKTGSNHLLSGKMDCCLVNIGCKALSARAHGIAQCNMLFEAAFLLKYRKSSN